MRHLFIMRYLFTMALLFFATTALAATDIVATYQNSDGSMITIVTRDKAHVRMDTSPTSYLLLKEKKVYSVSQDDMGQWMVMDMDQLKQINTNSSFMSLFGGGDQEAAPETETAYEANYEKTSQREKIAGYTGTVYNIEVIENGEIVRRDEVVLCTHSDLKKVNEGWMAISSTMSELMGEEMSKSMEQASKQAKEAGYGGMLRYGDEMKLSNLKKMNLSTTYYQLPEGAKMVQMGAMPQGMPSTPPNTHPPQQTPTQPQDLNPVPYPGQPQTIPDSQTVPQPQTVPAQQTGGLEQDAKDVGDAARDEAKQSTEEEVREGVRSIFKGLFD